MDAAATRSRHFDDCPGVQPPGRRSARCFRSAAALLLIALAVAAAGCEKKKKETAGTPQSESQEAGKPKSTKDFYARFLEREWTGLGEEFDAEGFIAGMQRYIDSDGAIYPPRDRRFRALRDYLYKAVPNPALLKPLLGPRKEAKEIEDWVMRRDHVAWIVVTTFYRRLARRRDDPYTEALWDAVAYAGAHSSFDPLFGDSHTKAGAEVSDLFMDPQLRSCAASKKALQDNMDGIIGAWRKRVTEKASTSMMAIFVRHLGAAGVDLMFGEWRRMSKSEQYNLLRQAGDHEGLAPASKQHIVDSLLADSIETREAALEALEGLSAPIKDIEIVAPEEELRAAVAALREWARKTDS